MQAYICGMVLHTIPNRAVLRLEGPDTLALLERTVTHTVADWAADEARYGALLTPQGKVIADYIAVRTENGVLIDCHTDAAGDLQKRLTMFRLRSGVSIERDDSLVVIMDEHGDDDPRSPDMPWRRIGPEGPPPLDEDNWSRLRIEAGVPEWGYDYRGTEVFPTDINMDHMNGIDYKKGCFVGQEVASRMKRKGTIRKRTLRVSGDALDIGADIVGKTPIGTVTSQHGTSGLALIRLDRLAAQSLQGEIFTCNGAPVRILTHKDDWATNEISAFYVDS